jgi:hypothetical protein
MSELPLKIEAGPRPEMTKVTWKGEKVPWLRRVTIRWDGAPEVELGAPDANRKLAEVDPNTEGDYNALLTEHRRLRDRIAQEMRNCGIHVTVL